MGYMIMTYGVMWRLQRIRMIESDLQCRAERHSATSLKTLWEVKNEIIYQSRTSDSPPPPPTQCYSGYAYASPVCKVNTGRPFSFVTSRRFGEHACGPSVLGVGGGGGVTAL